MLSTVRAATSPNTSTGVFASIAAGTNSITRKKFRTNFKTRYCNKGCRCSIASTLHFLDIQIKIIIVSHLMSSFCFCPRAESMICDCFEFLSYQKFSVVSLLSFSTMLANASLVMLRYFCSRLRSPVKRLQNMWMTEAMMLSLALVSRGVSFILSRYSVSVFSLSRIHKRVCSRRLEKSPESNCWIFPIYAVFCFLNAFLFSSSIGAKLTCCSISTHWSKKAVSMVQIPSR